MIHRAPWLLPISWPPVEDGAIAIQAGRTAAVGRFRQVVRSWPGAAVTDHPDAVLLPGLINAHTHIELSHLACLSRQPAPSSFTQWIALLTAERAKAAANVQTIAAAAQTALADQQAQGVVAIGDISSTGLTRHLASAFTGRLLCFEEYLGLRADAAAAALLRLQNAADGQLCTGHAPYSTHINILRSLKARAARLGQVFPIHTAESLAENELLCSGSGEMRAFLEARGFWDGSFQPAGEGGAVTYLHRHGLLDSSTLCIHSVHVAEEEIGLLAESGAKVCLCLGSNAWLGVGTAPVAPLLRRGILPALGTDSLSSNPELSIWREMRLLAEYHPDIALADILRMATLGGAAALGLADRLGTLEPGKDAVVLAVELGTMARAANGVLEQLMQQGGRCPLHRL